MLYIYILRCMCMFSGGNHLNSVARKVDRICFNSLIAACDSWADGCAPRWVEYKAGRIGWRKNMGVWNLSYPKVFHLKPGPRVLEVEAKTTS